MIKLSVSNLTKKFGVETLFSDVSFAVDERDRVALIGRNGTGKTTLLKIILGEVSDSNDSKNPGYVAIPKDVRVGYLSQHVIENVDNSLIQEALLVFKDLIEREKELNSISEQIAKNPNDSKLIETYGSKSELFERDGGYRYHYEIETILTKFGFDKKDFDRKVSSFSGGERSKIAFSKLLLQKPDLLILDEPTNHLDVSTIDWLENYLKSYPGAILFVSHDRYFINALSNVILNLENEKVTVYRGNFDSYIQQKEQNYETQLKAYNIQQKEIEKMERFIEYFKPKPRFVSRAKDREKKLEHLVRIEKPEESKKAINFKFNGNTRADKKIIDFEDVSIGYDGNNLAEHINFLLFGGDKLAIMGDNGTGKTTLIKSILEIIPVLKGNIKRLCKLTFGYIQQNDFDIKGSVSILEYFNNLFPEMGNKLVRNHLGRFDFVGDDVFKSLDVLSGGEKMRLIIAKLVLENYDVLLLDEPTNNLDIETRESLVKALEEYESCIIFVSHDRYFIDLVANKILYINKHEATYFEGSYTEFKEYENELTLKTDRKTEEKEKDTNSYQNKHEKTISQKTLNRMKEIENRLAFIEDDMTEEETYMDYLKMKNYEIEKKTLEEEYLKLMSESEPEVK